MSQSLSADASIFARRNAAHIRQIPEKLIDVTLQPIMFVLLFAYVFGGVIDVPGSNYREYLIGGILVQSLAFGMMGPGTAIATDLREGVIERFRSLPVSRAAYLIGHLVSEVGASLIALTILTGSGLLVGWRPHEDVLHVAGGFGLLILFSITMIWIGTLLGLISRSADGVQGLIFMTIFPLTFLSNAFVPAEGLPAALETFSNYNPVSTVVSAVRTLFGNATATPDGAPWTLQHPVVSAVGSCLLLLAIVVPLTLARYRARTTD
ncbi:Daunorubicin/doxorubicin resistance ABC transporter permease protein DrrB [Paraconexibacter sp. AEG42_29]|uniref:Transport permease protein n=1 Tax=Paraconexibacter sp. AEG42_29 TaxID=2997339 RepID=A0AAU7B0Z1_9ACTN